MIHIQWKFVTVNIFVILIFTYMCACASPVSVCITNCVQCKQMLGQYFEGRACGDACMATAGLIAPDCNNPVTVRSFLKRLY